MSDIVFVLVVEVLEIVVIYLWFCGLKLSFMSWKCKWCIMVDDDNVLFMLGCDFGMLGDVFDWFSWDFGWQIIFVCEDFVCQWVDFVGVDIVKYFELVLLEWGLFIVKCDLMVWVKNFQFMCGIILMEIGWCYLDVGVENFCFIGLDVFLWKWGFRVVLGWGLCDIYGQGIM